MSANKIAETSTTTGTGNVTLAGAWNITDTFATGNRTFNSFYGLTQRFPYMIQDKLGNWEKGIGYLSSTAVLVRDLVTDNSLATKNLIDFPVGEKLVMVNVDAGTDIAPKLRPTSGYAGSAFVFNNGSSVALVAARAAITPMLLKRPMQVTAFMISVTTAVAGSSIRLGLYQMTDVSTSFHSLNLIYNLGTVDSATTGDKEVSFTGNLGAGLYFIASISDAAPSVKAQGICMDLGLGGLSSNMGIPCQGFFKTGVPAGSVPASFGLLNGDMSTNTAMPRVVAKGQFV